MAHPKKNYTQYDHHIVRQDPGNLNHHHFTITANKHQDIIERVDRKNHRKVDNKVFYQFNLDDWQG